MTEAPELPRLEIAHASEAVLTTTSGASYVDLFCGSGTLLLGHRHPDVLAGLHAQIDRVWNTGILPTTVRDAAESLVASFFPPSHAVAGVYSTGMEASEFALRVARVATRRPGFVGFTRSTHGKSTATAALGWSNDHVELPTWHRLPHPPDCSEAELLERLEQTLRAHPVAAVFVEPIQGSGGGHALSRSCHGELARLSAAHGALLVFDEVLTGFHRTGPAFQFGSLGVTPDIVLVGKAMGNGFPVSGVVVARRVPIRPAMLPWSTYAGNPLAAAAVVATLEQMRRLPMTELVREVEAVIRRELGGLAAAGVTLRGAGALWVLELPTPEDAVAATRRAIAGGVLVSPAGRWIRIFPPATIALDRLRDACRVVRRACEAQHITDG